MASQEPVTWKRCTSESEKIKEGYGTKRLHGNKKRLAIHLNWAMILSHLHTVKMYIMEFVSPFSHKYRKYFLKWIKIKSIQFQKEKETKQFSWSWHSYLNCDCRDATLGFLHTGDLNGIEYPGYGTFLYLNAVCKHHIQISGTRINQSVCLIFYQVNNFLNVNLPKRHEYMTWVNIQV